MSDTNIYLIPGLGADRRMYLTLLEKMPHATVLEWERPDKTDTLHTYAQKMVDRIDKTKPFIIVGTSLGGIVSIEMCKILPPQKLVLVATVKNRNELPPYFRALKHLPLHRIISGKNFKRFNFAKALTLHNRRQTRASQLIMDMTNDADDYFVEWAINQVLTWTTTEPPQNYVHIHGTNDELFPIKYINNCIPVKGGSHVMNLFLAHEVDRLIMENVSG
jgi:pimeloyl-ACP methyl ester carboxylesterase